MVYFYSTFQVFKEHVTNNERGRARQSATPCHLHDRRYLPSSSTVDAHSARALAEQYDLRCLKQNNQIQKQTVVLGIVEIILQFVHSIFDR